MKNASRPLTKRWLTGAAAGLVALGSHEGFALTPAVSLAPRDRDGGETQRAPLARFTRAFENVLGTSLDLVIEAPRVSDALACETHLLAEIERLRRILSTYDPASEISAVMAGAPVRSTELRALLGAYAGWHARTDGLITAQLGAVIRQWREAARSGRMPASADLRAAAHETLALNVDALGKAFIIERAVGMARRFVPSGLLNLGGDIRAWGDTTWPIAVADPQAPADNAAPLATFALRDAAVATSGGYARMLRVGDAVFSHLIDPRTLQPLAVGGSATVVAPDAVTANALSTALVLAGRDAGPALARRNGVENFLLVSARGGRRMSGVFAAAAAAPTTPSASAPPKPAEKSEKADEKPSTSAPAATAAANPWPADFVVTMPIVLKKPTGTAREFYRPYVVVWVENTANEIVRTVAVWGTDQRWQNRLTWWTYQMRTSRRYDVTNVTRATRPVGAYSVTWDGRDDFGQRLPAGRYKLTAEICREKGYHVSQEAVVDLGGTEPLTAEWKETAESEAATVTYGPATK